MKYFFAALAMIAVASPAFGQSFDPSVGSGNIGNKAEDDSALGAYARVLTERKDSTGRTVLPYTLQEHRALEQAKGHLW